MVFEGLFASAKEKSKGETPLPTTTSSSSGNTGTKSKRKHSRSKKKKKAAIINTNTSSNESKSAAIISTQPQQSQSRQNNNNGSRKTGPSAISTRTQPTRMHTESRQNNNNGFRKRGPTPEAMLLSSKLKEFSTQKRLQEILELYHDRANDYIRDGHHACIVVDCCARCGCIQKGEEIVEQLKQSGDEISVQTITALLKGYAHSGMMDKAAALYIAMTKKRNNRDKPNIRTLNTMLRGCMWAAASCKVNGMNHLTSEYIWPSPSSNNHNHIIPDTSSYEYSISVLSQALRCNDAQKRLEEFMNAFGVKISKDTDNCNQNQGKHFSASDPSALETLGVCFFNIARAYALLGDHAKAIEYANNSMDVVSSARSTHQSNRSNGAQNQAGGKRAWKSSNDGKDDSRREGNDYSRRTESNSLFRAHKLNELESDVRMILSSSSDTGGRDKLAARSLARFLITRVLYFSGGGTTDLSASASFDSESENAALDPNHERRQLIDSLWLCFGLRAAMKKEFPDQVFESRNGGFKFSKILKSLNISKSYVLLDDGAVDFNAVFASVSQSDKDLLGASQETKSKRPLNIELGSGFGEWIVNQALNTPSSDYIAVELRSDRVGQMFSKALLHDKNSPIQNLCCVGSECGSFLRKRVKEASISKIFVNHPEPPTQVSLFF
jgi:pentatricopeptide repeat protein